MTGKDKSETTKPSKAPANRELDKDELDGVSGGVGSRHDPTSPGWTDPDPTPTTWR
jgi:hypothetical protein